MGIVDAAGAGNYLLTLLTGVGLMLELAVLRSASQSTRSVDASERRQRLSCLFFDQSSRNAGTR